MEARPLLELLEARKTLARATGQQLRAARVEVGMTQTEFADAIGVAQSYLSMVENGNRLMSTPTLEKVVPRLAELKEASHGNKNEGKEDARRARRGRAGGK